VAVCGALAWTSPALAEERGLRGVLAVRGERIVAAENADRLFVPASVHKLIVAAAALHHLGPEYRIVTTLRAGTPAAGGPIDAGTLTGDLILEAAGDPTWNERFHAGAPRAPLGLLARRLAAAGVRRVTGDLVVDAGRFPGRAFPTSRPASDYAYAYAAPTSALAVDENAVEVEIAPGPRIGAPGTMRLTAGGAAGSPRLLNHIVTVGKERHGVGTVDFLPVWEGDAIVGRGEYPISEPPYVISLSVPSPDLHAARHLIAALAAVGVEVAGEARLAPSPSSVAAAGPILARVASPPLAELLEPILTDSHNWYAEMLLRVTAAEVSGAGRLDAGLELLRRFLEDEVGCPSDAFHLDDASGLSPYDLITPRAVVELLRYVRTQPWRDVFLGALARPGEGTLEVWRALPPVAAKTGSIRHTLALAGYLDPQSPEPVVFAVFLNHDRGERGPRRAEIARLLRSWR
jgi:D-alanyl-D-alanine carboxypeptidase/D-alanyl-D-alanine-endopeptidase (penicillin-binding protein 4)